MTPALGQCVKLKIRLDLRPVRVKIRRKYTPEFKTKEVLEALKEHCRMGTIIQMRCDV